MATTELDFDYRLQHPCSVVITGKSFSGKSSFLRKLLLDYPKFIAGFEGPIHYCYGIDSPDYDQLRNSLPNIHFHHGIIDNLEQITDSLIVIDDLTRESLRSTAVSNLFTRGAHHARNSIFLTSHNLFPKEPLAREIVLNCSYLFIFRNCKDALSISTFALHAFGANRRHFLEAFDILTKEDHFSPLLFDCHHATPEFLRIRGNFLDPIQSAFVRKDERVTTA